MAVLFVPEPSFVAMTPQVGDFFLIGNDRFDIVHDEGEGTRQQPCA